MDDRIRTYVETCLEFGATVTIDSKQIVTWNPANDSRNTHSADKIGNAPAREAMAVCENLGLS